MAMARRFAVLIFGTLALSVSAININSGGPATGSWITDTYANTGNTFSSTATIDTSGVINPAPAAVYQTVRWASAFAYTVPGLTANAAYTVRLHFVELTWTAANQRKFNAAINGTNVLTNYDVFAAAGARNKAVVQQFSATANASGQIVIAFTQSSPAFDNPDIAGIEILPSFWLSGGSRNTNVQSATYEWANFRGRPCTFQTTYSRRDLGWSKFVSSHSQTQEYDYYLGVLHPQFPVPDFTDPSITLLIQTSPFPVGVGVINPAPTAVYQTKRWWPGEFTYTVPGLTANAPHTVRLHFAETFYAAPNLRKFNVAINGVPVLTNFDVFATAGAQNKAVVRQFNATANASGQIVIAFTQISPVAVENPMVSGIEVAPSPININSGGGATGAWIADTFANTGYMSSTTATINTNGVPYPAPAAVYQNLRWWPGAFTYTVPGLNANTPCTVRLHFAETFYAAPNLRKFNVAINGAAVLTNFDVFATAGAKDKAVVQQFNATANASGQIVIAFTQASPVVENPMVSGIEVIPSININSGGGATGSWIADNYANTGYMSTSTGMIDTGGATYDKLIAGDYNTHWQQIGTHLKNRINAGKPTIISIAWEMNGTFMPWGAKPSSPDMPDRINYQPEHYTTAAQYIAGYRKIVEQLRIGFGSNAVPTAWIINAHGTPPQCGTNGDAWGLYPGDDVVTYIGIDNYDMFPRSLTEAAFDTTANANGGLNWLAAKAVAAGKQVIVGEWGVNNNPVNVTNGEAGGDNPNFVQWMYDTFQAWNGLGLIKGEYYFNDAIGNSNVDSDLFEVNLALSKAAWASSTESSQYPASMAFDGTISSASRWSAAFNGDTQQIQVDLGSLQMVSRVVLEWETAYADQYTIATSTDGASWTTDTNWTTRATVTTGNGATDDLSFTAVPARYIRMRATHRATPYSYSLYEFKVYGGNPLSRAKYIELW